MATSEAMIDPPASHDPDDPLFKPPSAEVEICLYGTSRRLRRALSEAKIRTWGELVQRAARDFHHQTRKAGHELGRKDWQWLRDGVEVHGLVFMDLWPERDDIQPWEFVFDCVVRGGDSPRLGVYFVRGAGLIKIGIAMCVIYRLREIQAHSPVRLEGLGFIRHPNCKEAAAAEKLLHKEFAADRVYNEWFRETPALLQAIHDRAAVWPRLPDYLLQRRAI